MESKKESIKPMSNVASTGSSRTGRKRHGWKDTTEKGTEAVPIELNADGHSPEVSKFKDVEI